MWTPRSHPETKGPYSLSGLQPPHGLGRALQSASGRRGTQRAGHGGVASCPREARVTSAHIPLTTTQLWDDSTGRRDGKWSCFLTQRKRKPFVQLARICHAMWGRELLAQIPKIYFLFPCVFRRRLGQFTFHQPWAQDLPPPSRQPPTFPHVPPVNCPWPAWELMQWGWVGDERRHGSTLTRLLAPALGLVVEQLPSSCGRFPAGLSLTSGHIDDILCPLLPAIPPEPLGIGEMPLLPEVSLISIGDSIGWCTWPLQVFVKGPAEMTSLGAAPPNLLNQSLHLNETRRWFECLGKTQQHAMDSFVLAPWWDHLHLSHSEAKEIMTHACQTIFYTHWQNDVTKGFLQVKPGAESCSLS